MSATSDWRLYQLYREFGETQDRRGRATEAADAFALALYYARRLNDAPRIHECRQLVLARNPNHVAGQAVSAPLFFAQLLMRYPADEVEMMLSAARPEAAARVAVVEETEEDRAAPAARTFRQAQAARPEFTTAAHHHAEPMYEGRSRESAVGDDVLLDDAGLLGDAGNGRRTTIADLSTAVKALAAGSIASGLLLIAYVGYTLYPVINQMKAVSGHNADARVIVTDDADPLRPTEGPNESPAASPPPPIAPKPTSTPAVAEAGANTPVSLPDEPPQNVSIKPPAGDGTTPK